MPQLTPYPSRALCTCGCAYKCHTYRSNGSCAFCPCRGFDITEGIEALTTTGYIEAQEIRVGMFMLVSQNNIENGHNAPRQQWGYVRSASGWNGGNNIPCVAFSLQYATNRNMTIVHREQPIMVAQMEVDPDRVLR